MDSSPAGESAAWQPFLAAPLDGGPVRVEPVVAEEPLEIRVRGAVFAVLLRTPGRERDLIAGFLAAERVIRGSEDLSAVEPCYDAERSAPAPHVWNASLAEGVAFDPRHARALTVGSACGLCGTRVLEDLRVGLPRTVAPTPDLGVSALREAFQELQRRQTLFSRTAGCHGAALVQADGSAWRLLDHAEDVGRHNATDKVLGARLLAGDYPLEQPTGLLVSGRVSYEIVQKAALAGVGAVAGVGMPTSLAVAAARACGLSLRGFVRDAGGLHYAPLHDEALL